MNLTSQLTALRNESRNLPINQRAELACRLAKELEKAGEYEAACEALSEFWPDRNQSPNLEGLDQPMQAEALLRVGALAGWLGAANPINGSQEIGKNLITRSIEIFDQLGASTRSAEAHKDLAICYWREGSFDEARIHLEDARNRLKAKSDELLAVILMWSGIVESQAGLLQDAWHFYNQATPLIQETSDHALKGAFHNQLALFYRNLCTSDHQSKYTDRALIEFAAASYHFEEAGHLRYRARVENNLGELFSTIGRFEEANAHLRSARDLFSQLRDNGSIAQVDETRARTLLAEGHLRDAERMIRSTVRTLERGGQQAVLVEALTTQGTIKARLGKYVRARELLDRAIEVAQTAGDLEGAGRAKLSIIEELSRQTPVRDLPEIYGSADELLDRSQDPATNKRLNSCARKVIDALVAEDQSSTSTASQSWEGFSFKEEIKRIERTLLARALRDAGGSVTKAARLLGFKHHQSIIAILKTRHQDLLDHRSAVRKRRRHLFSQPRGRKTTSASQITILHVEDHKDVAKLVEDLLAADRFRIERCVNGLTAWEILKGKSRYDILIVDNNLPGLSGLELVLLVRNLPHRRKMPIIMLSGDDVEKEAWRARVNAFVSKSQAVDKLSLAVARVLKERRK